jgi:hypothetical protein
MIEFFLTSKCLMRFNRLYVLSEGGIGVRYRGGKPDNVIVTLKGILKFKGEEDSASADNLVV